jgi:hypothetical protein
VDTPDDWGLMPAASDPSAVDPEIGWSTTDDGWEPLPLPLPVTRTVFAMHFAWAAYGLLRTLVCRTGIHRRRRYL